MTNYIIKASKYIIYFGFASLFFVTPLVMTPINSELFEFNKMMFVYAATVVISVSWVIGELCKRGNHGYRGNWGFREFGGFRVRKTPLDIPIFFFLVSQIVSTFYSIDPHISIWGYYSRQNGGLLSTIAYIVLFYAFVSNIWEIGGNPVDKGDQGKRGARGKIGRLLYFALASGFLVATYGILQHFGIDKDVWVQDVVNRVFSSLGQPNWLAAYMAVLSFVSLGIGLGGIMNKGKGNQGDQGDQGNKGNRGVRGFGVFRVFRDYFWVGVVGVFYLTILYTKSRSGLLGFWVGNAVFWSLVGISRIRRIGYIRRIFLTFNFALLTFNFIFGVPLEKFNQFMLPGILREVQGSRFKVQRDVIGDERRSLGVQGTAIEQGGTESGEIRKYVWQAAWEAAKENPLFGTGVETFVWAFYRYKPVEHNLTSEWDFLYNKAHNEYLNYAATTGFIGLGAYLLVIGVFGLWAMRKIRGDWGNKLVTGLFAAWVSILVTNFFGFSVVVTSLYFWLIPAMMFSLEEVREVGVEEKDEKGTIVRGLIVGVVVIVAGYLLVVLGKYWYADVLYARGKHYRDGGYTLQSNRALTYAVELRPGEPIFWDELGFLKGTLAIEAADRKEATHAAELVASALDQQGKALRISPQNLNFLKTRVKLYYALSEIFDGNLTSGDPLRSSSTSVVLGEFLELAIETLELGRELAPNDPKILYNLALLYAAEGDSTSGRDSTPGVGGAIETLQEALDLKPDYKDARIALGLFYQEEGELEKAREQFEYILEKINPEDEEAAQYLKDIEKS